MTDTSRLNAEAATISKQSPAIRAFAIDSAQATVDLNARLTRLEQQIAALTPAPAPPPSGFVWPGKSLACGYSPMDATEIAQAVEIGAECVRLDSPSDATIQRLLDAGIRPWVICNASPVTPTSIGVSPATYGAQWAARANQWKGHGILWECLNEPDLHGWTPELYLPYLKAWYAQVKAADPSGVALHGGIQKWTQPTAGGSIAWVKRLYAAGGHGFFDGFPAHPYDDPADHGAWSAWDMLFGSGGAGFYDGENVRSVMNANGDDHVPILAGEAGGPLPKYSEAKQAQIVTNALACIDGQGLGYRKLATCAIYCLLATDGGTPGFEIAGHQAYASFKAAA